MLKIELKDIDRLSEMIIEQMRRDHFSPDEVVGIEKGGRLLASSIAGVLSLGVVYCEARRSLSGAKKNISELLRHLPDWLIRFLRRMEVDFRLYGRRDERHVMIRGSVSPNKKYLIIDDSLDTGLTMSKVVQRLLENGVVNQNIRIGVINILSELKLRPIILPHYYIYKNVHIQYPWSSDSPEFNECNATFARLH